MAERRDKLGRRIPKFDRSAASKKGAKTQKEKYGTDFHARSGASGGRSGRRGGFAHLKAQDPQKHKELSSKGGHTGTNYFSKLKAEDPEKFKEISGKGGKTKAAKNKTDGSGSDTPVSGRRA